MLNLLSHVMKVALVAVQWLIVAWGLVLILVAINTYSYEIQYFSTISIAGSDLNTFTPPTFLRMATGVGTGLACVGIGAVLFYLRRIFLRGGV